MVFGAGGKGDDAARIAKLKKALNQVGDGPAVPPGVAEYVSSGTSATAKASPSSNATACAPAKPSAVPSVVTDESDSASSTSTSQPASTNANPDDNPIRVAVLHVSKARFATALAPQQVIHNLNQAISEDPLDPELVYQRAKAYIQEDKLDRALSDLSDVIRQQPNRSDFYLARAWVYHLMGNQVLSNMDLQQARFVDPLFPAKIDWGK
jgi:predicted Zn-dependent protease